MYGRGVSWSLEPSWSLSQTTGGTHGSITHSLPLFPTNPLTCPRIHLLRAFGLLCYLWLHTHSIYKWEYWLTLIPQFQKSTACLVIETKSIHIVLGSLAQRNWLLYQLLIKKTCKLLLCRWSEASWLPRAACRVQEPRDKYSIARIAPPPGLKQKYSAYCT